VTALRLRAEDYLAMRRSLGFKLVSQGRTLMSFVGYAEAASAETITTDLAVDWARSAGGAGKPSYWAQRLSVVRMFARHLSMLEAGHEIPPVKVLRQRTRRITPYIYSDEEIAALLQAAARLRPGKPCWHCWPSPA
jgi:integrase/recombinase XerD